MRICCYKLFSIFAIILLTHLIQVIEMLYSNINSITLIIQLDLNLFII